LTLKARGLTGAQLPELPLPSSADLKLYPDRSATDTQANTGVVVGQREQKIALVPTRPGTFQLPEIRIPWWDTQADALREAVIPAHRITVTGAPAPSTPAQSAPAQQQATKTPAVPVEPSADAKPEPQKTPSSTVKAAQSPRLPDTLSSGASYWFWIALALLIAWIATLLLWWRARSRMRAVSPSADDQEMGLSQREALRELKQACQANDVERTKKLFYTGQKYGGRIIRRDRCWVSPSESIIKMRVMRWQHSIAACIKRVGILGMARRFIVTFQTCCRRRQRA
jgi:hypothetical protein